MRLLPLLLAAVVAAPSLAAQTAPLTPLYTLGDQGTATLTDVRTARLDRDELAVLSRPAPALQIRASNGTVRSWGNAGEGPGELRDPIDMVWGSTGALVLDMGSRRLTRFDRSGTHRETRSLGGTWANRIAVIGADTLLHTLIPMTQRRAVVRLRGNVQDTVLRYEVIGASIRLEAAGAPSYTVPEPFSPQSQWTAVPGIGYAFWAPGSATIAVFTADGRPHSSRRIPEGVFPVTAADREHWLQAAIPQEFMGQRVFEPIRAEARRTMRFPGNFGPVLELAGAKDGGVWVRRTSSGSGEVWQLAGGPAAAQFRLRPGTELLAITDREVLVRATSDEGEPTVEVLRLPR